MVSLENIILGYIGMTEKEAANFIEILQKLGWNGEQINCFQLGIAGRLTIEDTVNQIKYNKEIR